MDYTLFLKQLESSLLPFLSEEEGRAELAVQIKKLTKRFRADEFKLQRTIRDKQITNNVLQNTITELKIQSENLKHQKKLTEEQAAFKEQLFATVSHELRTPLHGILGMSHLLKDTHLQREQKEFVEIIKGSADNLLVIINELLNLSHINAGKTIIRQKPFSIKKLLSEIQKIISFKVNQKGLNLSINIPENLPDFLIGDPTRLQQILLNLLNNAIKYTRKGKVTLNANIISQSEQNVQLQLDIIDTGIGIEADKLGSIFESFTQLEVGTGEVYEGVGLGLNIVKKLISLMKGKIQVVSERNRGTKFSVFLDFEYLKEGQLKNVEVEVENFSVPNEWQHKKILLLEDNEANIFFVQNLFGKGKVQLEVATDIASAQKKLKEKLYDCILSDVKLPDGNGLNLMAKLRKDMEALNQNTPVIVLTASANEKEVEFAKEYKLQQYISKPFAPTFLIEEIKKIFQQFNNKKNKNSAPSFSLKIEKKEDNRYFSKLESTFKNKPHVQIEMLDIFLQQIPLAMEQMEKGLAENNLEVIYYDAHRIKSTINIIGLPNLSLLIGKINNYCHQKIHLDKLPILYAQFKTQALTDIDLIEKRKEDLLIPSK